MKPQIEAQRIFNWIADTQFSIVYDGDGKLIPRRVLTEQIRYRAKTYIDFCFSHVSEIPNVKELIEIKNYIDGCFYKNYYEINLDRIVLRSIFTS